MNFLEILTIVFCSSGLTLMVFFLMKRQKRFISTLKVGQKVMYNGKISEVVEIKSDTQIVIKTEVSGMRLSEI